LPPPRRSGAERARAATVRRSGEDDGMGRRSWREDR
jgi:hypothetical protein